MMNHGKKGLWMKNEHMMALAAQLRQSQQSLRGRIAQDREGASSRIEAAAEHFGHPQDSHAQVTTARELALAMTEMEIAELNALQEALDRMAAGTYGACTDCGKDIALARLQATPEAARCIGCQTAREHPTH
jgi:DnaK suppressor protein